MNAQKPVRNSNLTVSALVFLHRVWQRLNWERTLSEPLKSFFMQVMKR